MLEPSALTAAGDKTIAQKPSFGGEEKLYVCSNEPHTEPASYLILGLNSGTLSLDAAEAAALLATPQELIAVLETPLKAGSTNVVVSVTGTDAADGALTATFTFKPPGWAKISEKTFPVGFGAGAVSSVDGTKFKTIVSATVACAAGAAGVKVTFFGVPSISAFTEVGCRTQSDYTTKASVPKSIACGTDSSAFVKPGMTKEGTLDITTKLVSAGDGLARFDGVRSTYLIETVKEKKVTTDRLFFLGAILEVTTSAPDGDGEVTAKGTGKYEDMAILVAK